MHQQGYDARERIVVPLLFPVLTLALLVVTAAIDLATPVGGPGLEIAGSPGWPFAGLGMVFGACAGVVLRFDPRQRFGWLLGGPFPDLTDRERQVLELLASGAGNDAIARATYVSDKTVRNTISSIYSKLHAAGRGEAIVKAREAGYGKG